MLKCSNCEKINKLIICSKCNTIFCEECHKDNNCNTCNNDIFYKLYKRIFNGYTIDFIDLTRFPVGFCGFDRFNRSLMDIIDSINQIEESIEKNILLIFFPNKIQSINFSKKLSYSDENEDEIVIKSKYRIVFTPENIFYLFNYENIRPTEIIFLIKLLVLIKTNTEDAQLEFENYKFIPYDALKIMNARIGIDFISHLDFDEVFYFNFFSDCYKSFHEYSTYKKLITDSPIELLDYLHNKIELDNIDSLKNREFLYDTDLFELYLYTLRLNLIQKSVKDNPKIYFLISEHVYNKIEEIFSLINNTEVKNVFNNFFSDIKSENFDSNYDYHNFIKASTCNIFKHSPLIFLRYNEINALWIYSRNLIFKTQSMIAENPNIKIIPNLSDHLELLYIIKNVLNKEIPIQYRIILLTIKFSILEEIVIRSKNSNYFKLLLETHSELESLFLQNHKTLKKDELFKLDFVDIFIEKIKISYIYFMFKDIKNAKDVLKKVRVSIDLYQIPDFYKINMLFVNFQFFEDYTELKEIYNLYINPKYIEDIYHEAYFENLNEVICKFSSHFVENECDLSEMLNLIQDQILIPEPFIKNINEIRGLEIFIAMFYHIVNASRQNSTFLMLSELEKALEFSELLNEINEGRYPYDYYLLKTLTIDKILKENVNEVKKIVTKLDYFELSSKEAFKGAVIYWLDSTLEIQIKNLDIISQLKAVDDPWCNLIYKIIKDKIIYSPVKIELENVRKLNNMDDQLLKFKENTERNGINSFWESRIKGKLKPQPEEIAKFGLISFFRATEFYTHIGSENEEGVGKCDILTVSKKNEKNIIELKIVKSKRDIEKGIEELLYYITKEGLKEGYLILFDTRKNNYEVKDKIIINNKVINQYLVKIYEIAPSK